ncbi:MAG: hypothetical protein EXR76_07670 [Myxococcales bacterium]|nr:hypothetical protein [Myxococcales bacterium]
MGQGWYRHADASNTQMAVTALATIACLRDEPEPALDAVPAFYDRLEGRENDRFDNGLENGARIGVSQYIAGEDHDNLSSSLTAAGVWALRLSGVPSNDYRIQRSL